MSPSDPHQVQNSSDPLKITKAQDFQVDGTGAHKAWQKTDWNQLTILDETEDPYETKFKMMYSSTGIYVLASCEDKKISSDFQTDQGDIWEGDVFEVFLQPDKEIPIYFEYEINALNTELAILVSNNDKEFFGWSPWHYEDERKISKAVHINTESDDSIQGWTAEFFIPYALFKGLRNSPPESGTEWRANFYRMDYDSGKRIKWSWKPISQTFHEYKKFGSIIFE